MDQPKKQVNIVKWLLITVIILSLVFVGMLVVYAMQLTGKLGNGETTVPTTTELTVAQATVMENQQRKSVATANILVTGNVLPSKPLVDTAMKDASVYDFMPYFRWVESYVAEADYAIANLETTLSGVRSAGYTGDPSYNSPDELAKTLADTGFDGLLTAHNHSYDGDASGFHRTVTTLRETGLDAIGTITDASEVNYVISDLNGIKVGFLGYTYETEDSYADTPSLNGILMNRDTSRLINSYLPTDVDPFLEECGETLSQMKANGAEVCILFLHWGDRFASQPTDGQRNLAQRLADLGFDAVVGTHPHIIQEPVLLESRLIPGHKTLVLYSLGNFISNQRRAYVKNVPDGHTEDGILVNLTYQKYSDGKVYLEEVEGIPLWVNLRSSSRPATYTVIPLEAVRRGNWKMDYDLSEDSFKEAKRSQERTEAIFKTPLETINETLFAEAENRNTSSAAALG